jgi:hypothetical protein
MTDRAQWDALQEAVRQDCHNLRNLLLLLSSAVGFAVAFPSHVRDRERLHFLLRKFGANFPPYPGLYDDSGEDRPCADCTIVLNVSPYVAGAEVPVVCPSCGIQRARTMRKKKAAGW